MISPILLYDAEEIITNAPIGATQAPPSKPASIPKVPVTKIHKPKTPKAKLPTGSSGVNPTVPLVPVTPKDDSPSKVIKPQPTPREVNPQTIPPVSPVKTSKQVPLTPTSPVSPPQVTAIKPQPTPAGMNPNNPPPVTPATAIKPQPTPAGTNPSNPPSAPTATVMQPKTKPAKAPETKSSKPNFKSMMTAVQDPSIQSIIQQWKQSIAQPQQTQATVGQSTNLAKAYQQAIVKALNLTPVDGDEITWGYQPPAKLSSKQLGQLAKSIALPTLAPNLGTNPKKGSGVSVYGYTPPGGAKSGFTMDQNTGELNNLDKGVGWDYWNGKDVKMSKEQMIVAYGDSIMDDPNADWSKPPPVLEKHGITQDDWNGVFTNLGE